MLDDDFSSQHSRSSDPRITEEVLMQEKIRTKETKMHALQTKMHALQSLKAMISLEEFTKREDAIAKALLAAIDEN